MKYLKFLNALPECGFLLIYFKYELNTPVLKIKVNLTSVYIILLTDGFFKAIYYTDNITFSMTISCV